MGAVAGPAGLLRVVLPHYRLNDLAEMLAWEHPGAERDEGPFESLIRLSRDYLNGRRTGFDEISCDLPGEGTFSGKVLRMCRTIPYGRTMSYSHLARQIGRDHAARAAAGALGRNPVPMVIPCHRVTYADGRAGGFSAAGGVELKQRMLALEAQAAGSSPDGGPSCT